MRSAPEPDYDDPKEVYAFFGLAMYNANLIEASLINLAVVLHLEKVNAITQEIFDAKFITMESKTLGQLLKATRTLISVPENTEELLNLTLSKRNHLAHNFFREHAETILHPKGRRQIIDELHSMIELFINVDELITPIYLSLWDKYGVTESFIEQTLNQAYADNAAKYGEL